MTPAKKSKKTMSDEHKAALAAGRVAGNAVRRYLEALEANRPKRGRKRTADSIKARLEKVNAEIPTAASVRRLSLIQERNDLERDLANIKEGPAPDVTALEAEFVQHARAYGESKGISYKAWREIGVPAQVLAKAGISRSAG